MRTALLLSGKTGGSAGRYNAGDRDAVLKIGYEQYKKNVLDVNENMDVFAHCWDGDYQEIIDELYNPVDFVFERQPEFTKKPNWGDPNRAQASWGMWESRRKVCELMEMNGVHYDRVLLSRFDIFWNTPFDLSSLDDDKFYTAKINPSILNGNFIDLPAAYAFKDRGDEITVGWPTSIDATTKTTGKRYVGVSDIWFASNMENMIKFCSIYDNFESLLDKECMGYISNHSLAHRHIDEIGLMDKLELKFKIIDDCPLVRWKCFNAGA